MTDDDDAPHLGGLLFTDFETQHDLPTGDRRIYKTYEELSNGYLDWTWMLDYPGVTGSPDFIDTRWPMFKLHPLFDLTERAVKRARIVRYQTIERTLAAWRALRHGTNWRDEDDW